jgi:selenocysteine lyase/cysteine desulfurase
MKDPLAQPTPAALRLVGSDDRVPLITGSESRYVNLDYSASTPPLAVVAAAVAEFLPWYSSVHRGAGYKSQVATAAYEGARRAVGRYFGARPDDAVLFVRNTTDAMNLLASALPTDTEVFAFALEHHANLLPWRRRGLRITYLPMPGDPGEAEAVLSRALEAPGAATRLVAVTGASNVTGEIWPLRELVEIAHRHGARVVIDAAQLAAHHPVDLTTLGADYLAASGHKMYAPFGAGVLIGRPDWLARQEPYLRGGGAVDFVTLDSVMWSALPDRQEAGSPNVVGAVAMGAACDALSDYGLARLAEHEKALATYARERLARIDRVEVYRLWPEESDRLGIATFNLAGVPHSLLAAILSAEFGIGVRHGCFCAHPLMIHLLRVSDARADQIRAGIASGDKSVVPGAVRASMGIGTTTEDIDALVEAVEIIAAKGPSWTYRLDAPSGEYMPEPETRDLPNLRVALSAHHDAAGGESS